MDLGSVQRLRTIATDPAESDQIRNLTGALARIERERLAALRVLIEATGRVPGHDVELPDLPDEKERITELCDVLGAKLTGDVWGGVWLPYYCPPAVEAPEQAIEYAKMDPDEWEAQIETWASRYRAVDSFDAEGMTDREIAAAHVLDQFGMELDEFEEQVVAWTEAEVLDQAVAGPMQAMDTAAKEAAAQLHAKASLDEQAADAGGDDGAA